MSATLPELATEATKEFFLKLLDHPDLTQTKVGEPSPFTGVALANHLGECYKALYKKVYASLKETSSIL